MLLPILGLKNIILFFCAICSIFKLFILFCFCLFTLFSKFFLINILLFFNLLLSFGFSFAFIVLSFGISKLFSSNKFLFASRNNIIGNGMLSCPNLVSNVILARCSSSSINNCFFIIVLFINSFASKRVFVWSNILLDILNSLREK